MDKMQSTSLLKMLLVKMLEAVVFAGDTDYKISLIKTVRGFTGMGLYEAKQLVDKLVDVVEKVVVVEGAMGNQYIIQTFWPGESSTTPEGDVHMTFPAIQLDGRQLHNVEMALQGLEVEK
jgi:hypothetical protein